MDNNSFDRLAYYFSKFPGIGERQSKRFVYFLLRQNPSYISDLSNLIRDIKNSISQCTVCFRHFSGGQQSVCDYCAGVPDKTTLVVLEKEADYE